MNNNFDFILYVRAIVKVEKNNCGIYEIEIVI
jgi:hypothetical protein